MSLETHDLRDLLPVIKPGHQLADAVDQDVSIVDRRHAFGRWFDFNPIASMFVLANPVIRLGGQAENGMLHRCHVSLGSSVEDVADKEIRSWVSVRQQRRTISDLIFRFGHKVESSTFRTPSQVNSSFHTRALHTSELHPPWLDTSHTEVRHTTHLVRSPGHRLCGFKHGSTPRNPKLNTIQTHTACG